MTVPIEPLTGSAPSPSLHQQPSNIFPPLCAKLDRYIDALFRMQMIIAGMGLAALMCLQVVMRYLVESPFAGIEEAAILLGVWVYFPGMGYATRMQEHIHGGIVSLIITEPKTIVLIRIFGAAVCMAAAVVFGYFALKYALFVIAKGRTSINLQWPRGLWSASMIVGFSMMSCYFLAQLIRECWLYRQLSRNDESA